jgi:hypothetical protein
MNAITTTIAHTIKRIHDIFVREKMNVVVVAESDQTKVYWSSMTEEPFNNLEDMIVNHIPFEVFAPRLGMMDTETSFQAEMIIKALINDLERKIVEIKQYESLVACGAFSGAFSSSTYEDHDTSNIGL